MKKIFLILFLLPSISLANNADSATIALHPKQLKWEFDGVFGRFDRASAQRGYQIYKEVCSSCHSLKLVAYRNLEELGFSKEEVKQIASEALINDGPNDDGEMFERPGLPSDHFASPYANEQAARSVNSGAYPPDLSLIVKARHDGANYVYSLLTGFADAPEDFPLAEGKSYNPYFEGRQISMPPPITDDGQVDYKDDTFATKEQMAIDVVNFLQWAAEPETEHRKKMGVRSMIFLGILFVILLAAKKAVWKKIV
ncbi:MAG: cytochrome C [Alphaproteobacteria bacterium RIFCSPLOWO2_01_FULL_40_26]|nr:MAG: cytochrome C [Alphaproteobacteria bacterium RIFCSPHIGHO2_02_FULL_40_34]OFW94270.1 MAG: cytochrome C [Alphaproteobacteria bacterium RIFCSPLOWO2_01_FULL_40_26]OFX09839.1 MAG: cytochrome C [Alphaproteobacteria bacterium RIFCSPLOWO2_02_FULL_40_19]OFX11422.1 MAG: cytochrome C [Alphaproteobacteria bacterium RIFCSPLOWO2_12_FULL_40_11]